MRRIEKKLQIIGLKFIQIFIKQNRFINKTEVSKLIFNYYLEHPNESYSNKSLHILLNNTKNYFNPTNIDGHLTCSAWIINKEMDKALLLKHRGLKMWLQPGGHISAKDKTLTDSIKREVLEETGLSNITLLDDKIFDIDIHKIPRRIYFPEHLHYDLRFAFEVSDKESVRINFESIGYRWMSFSDILKSDYATESLIRLIKKTYKLKS